jgi:hypothetical protein
MKKINLLALLFLLTVVGCTGAGKKGPVLSVGDQAQIFAATIRQIYTVDHSFDKAPGWPLVYVISVTDDSALAGTPGAPSQPLSPALQDAIAAELADQSFEVIWIESRDEAPVDPADGRIAGGDGIIIALGSIQEQDDGSAQLSFFMTCGGLCGIGKTYVLKRAGDAWRVTGSVGPEIIS